MDWLINCVIFLFGIVAGGLLYRWFLQSNDHEQDKVEKQLRELQEEFAAYRENVNLHFSKTTELVNNLTESYSEVHKHLVEGAQFLSHAPQSGAQISFPKQELSSLESDGVKEFIPLESKINTDALIEATADADFDSVQAPRDYAPRANPNEPGTLSEGFGLKEKV
ncbi:MAG TPA: DUF1043 family protein [Pseudomonadales bacterium]|nr:DUF1043 family protein [Pseudomonadales bacterium]